MATLVGSAVVERSDPLDRLDLIAFLALVLLVNAIILLVVLRPRRGRGSDAEAPTVSAPAITSSHWSPGSDAAWSGLLDAEASRCRRYGRTAAVVAFRLDGLAALEREAGRSVRDWLADTVRSNLRAWTRASDAFQHDDGGSYRLLLVEADEQATEAFVERITRSLQPWLAGSATHLQVDVGWAVSGGDHDLAAVDRLAAARLVGAAEGWIRSSAARRSAVAVYPGGSRTRPSRTA
jgi:GGDEF domain-containing protein